ncbi:hypothetical protein CIP106467_1091 [Citrobacter europaeus]|nr:hypothetical protein CIP106467_1091 [Citrobacter europaeus]
MPKVVQVVVVYMRHTHSLKIVTKGLSRQADAFNRVRNQQ